MNKLASVMLCLLLLTGCGPSAAPSGAASSGAEPKYSTYTEDFELWHGTVDGVECLITRRGDIECDWSADDVSDRARGEAQ